MRQPAKLGSILCWTVISVTALHASAETSPAPPSRENERRAASLFAEARKAVAAGHCTTAIPKLREVLSLISSIGAHLSLAQCSGDDPLTAWQELKEAEREAAQSADNRAPYAQKKAAALEPRLALVRIVLPVDTTTQRADVRVRVDSSPLDEFFWRGAFAVSPGAHTIEVSAPGRKAWSASVSASPGTTVLAEVVLRPDEPPAAATAPTAPVVPAGAPSAGAAASRGPWKTVGWVLVGAGVVGVGTGTVFGLIATGDKASAHCIGNAQCEAGPLSNAYTHAHVSDVGFIAGGVFLAGGVGLVLLRSSPAEGHAASARLDVAPSVGPGWGTVIFRGNW